MTPTLDLLTIQLAKGAHKSFADGGCVMELVSYIAGEPWSDSPKCVSPVIAAFLRRWNVRDSDIARFFAKVTTSEACWLWTAGTDAAGYGSFRLHRHTHRAHVFSYELAGLTIPDGLVLDHTCHNTDATCVGGVCKHRRCVNPSHLEPVTRGENLRRSRLVIPMGVRHRAKTHCPKGHPYSGENLHIKRSGHRVCRACSRLRVRKVSQS